jgi:uncharacterized protein with HEPN domain
MKRDYRDYLLDIQTALDKIEEFTESFALTDFAADEKTQLAVVKCLEIIGEAAKKVPPALKKKYPHVPWRQISGMRDKLVHEYFGINIKVVWRTITEDIPPLKPAVAEIIKKLHKN